MEEIKGCLGSCDCCVDLPDAKRQNAELVKVLARAKTLERQLYEDNRTLAAKCKEHYDNCQRLMRYELHISEGEQRVATGTVTGTNENFECGTRK